jgi:hypothetical protein
MGAASGWRLTARKDQPLLVVYDDSSNHLAMKFCNRYMVLAVELFSTGALLALVTHSSAVYSAQPTASAAETVPAEFRGCESARACRFRIEWSTSSTELLYVVRPNGVRAGTDGDGTAIAVRDRLNFLMSNMIHQHKRIELQDLRKLDDGTYGATVKINGMDLGADPILNSLMETSKN